MLPFLSVFLVINILLHTTALPQGAPESICDTLLPFHGGGIPPSQLPSPFRISPQASAVAQGQILRIQIDASPPELTFGGFMLHARSTTPPYRVVGRFAPSADGTVKLIRCDGGTDNTVTHTSPSPKRSFGFDWQAPADFVGDVVFNGTIAQEYDVFWVGLESTRVQVLPKGQVPTSVGISTQRPPLFSSTSKYVPAAQAQKPVARDPFYEGCGDTKSCFGFPSNCIESQDCKAISSTTVKGDKYIFDMKSGHGLNPAYIALGFSHDNKMGEASVIECIPESGIVNIYSSWTTVAPYTALRDNVSQRLMRLLDASFIDGVIQCSFERDAVSTVRDKTFDLVQQPMHLLLAMGSSLKPKGVGYHDLGKESTAVPRFLAEVSNFGASSKLLIRLHGAFMIIAWIGCTSVGILLARYFKKTWVGKSACGNDVWFTCHRSLMVLTWLLTIAGSICIFVELGGWSQVQNPHAILGAITSVLCFIQPIGALFRPHPGHKNRPLFNWGHWLGGNLAHILAIVTLFYAVKLAKAELPDWMDFILVAYVAFHVFIHFIFSIAGCVSDRRHVQRVTSFPMTDISPSRNQMMADRKQDAPFSGFKKILLGIYILVIIIFVAALVVVVVLAPIESTVDSLKSKIMN